MKVKTSVTLEPETLRAIDEIADESQNRSRIVEKAVLEFVERRRRAERDARDLDILNRSADGLNEEVEDILEFQAERQGTGQPSKKVQPGRVVTSAQR